MRTVKDLLSEAAMRTLSSEITRLCTKFGAEAIAAEVQRYDSRKMVPLVDKVMLKHGKTIVDDAPLLETARRMEQERNLKPWPTTSEIAGSIRYTCKDKSHSEWLLINKNDPYCRTNAARLFRKFTKECGRRYRAIYLVSVPNSDRVKVRRIIAEQQKRIGKSVFSSEQDISDEYLEELRSAVADAVRLDLEVRREFTRFAFTQIYD